MINHVSVIQQEQIEALKIRPATCVEWVKEAFLMKDDIQMPAKLSVHPQGEDFITSMPCLLPEKEGKKYFGIKVTGGSSGSGSTGGSSGSGSGVVLLQLYTSTDRNAAELLR